MNIDLSFLKNIFLLKNNVVDALTSTDTDKALSAKQGKVLKELIDQDIKVRGHIQLSIPTSLQKTWADDGIIKAAEVKGSPNIDEFIKDMLLDSGIDDNEIVSFISPYNNDYFIALYNDQANIGCILYNPEVEYKEATITYDDDTTETVHFMTL